MIKLLVVDDSALMRRLLTEIFEAAGDFEVAVARDGAEALALLDQVRPDVVTLDIQMPGLSGLACLDRVMVLRPCPVVMFSSLTADGAQETLEALALGAVDFMAKPGGAVSMKVDEFGAVLVDKVRIAAKARLSSSHRLRERIRLRAAGAPAQRKPVAPRLPSEPVTGPARHASLEAAERFVLVGTSTGGPPALDALLQPLPASFPWPIVVAQHMPASFTGPLAKRLDRLCALQVVEVIAPTLLEPGCVYIGRGDADVILSRRGAGLVALSAPSSAAHRWHPSVDRLVNSAMDHAAPESLLAVLMTGMGDDGAAAISRLRQAGGHTIAEAEETAVVWGMPGELVRAGGAEFVLPLDEIAGKLVAMAA